VSKKTPQYFGAAVFFSPSLNHPRHLNWHVLQRPVKIKLTSPRINWKDLAEVQDFATQWLWPHNHDQPNMALCGFTPKQRLALAE
jgi:putative transposase